MTAGIRERLGTLQKGLVTNISGSIPPGVSAIPIPLASGIDYLIVSRVDIYGVTTPGAVTYDLTNGAQLESGFANNFNVDCFIPAEVPLAMNVANNQATDVYYNLIIIYITSDDYDCYVRGEL